jgi:hypothetical protein
MRVLLTFREWHLHGLSNAALLLGLNSKKIERGFYPSEGVQLAWAAQERRKEPGICRAADRRSYGLNCVNFWMRALFRRLSKSISAKSKGEE